MAAAPAQPEETVWHLYLVRTREGDLYTGIAKDVERRIDEHGRAPAAQSTFAAAGPSNWQRTAGDSGSAA